jgi:hypothetical protein
MSAAAMSAPPPRRADDSTVQLAIDLRAELARVGIVAGEGGAWPILAADRNVYGTDMVVLGRITVESARLLLAALRECQVSPR